MKKLAFLASFLAAFITLDEQFLDGATTRMVWSDLGDVAHSVDRQVNRLMRPLTRR